MAQVLMAEANEVADHRRAEWPAALNLLFSGGEFGTRLLSSKHLGPLYVQKAFYPEGERCAHVYILHPPGGIVSGDALDIDVQLDNGSSVLITTPGASRLYRARYDSGCKGPLLQKVSNKLFVNGASCLEWLPSETIVFDGAHIELSTEIHLDEASSICAWEINCLGLPTNKETFKTGDFSQVLSVYKDNRPLFVDRLFFSGGDPMIENRAGLNRNPIFGSLVCGPFDSDILIGLIEELLEEIEQSNSSETCAITSYNDLLVVRYLGGCSAAAREVFTRCWMRLRPKLLGRQVVKPRIWAT